MASFGCDSQEVSPVSLLTRQLAFANFNLTPKCKLSYSFEDDFPTPILKKEVPRTKKYAKRSKSLKQRTFGTSLHNLKSAVYDECANLEPPCLLGKEESTLPSTTSDCCDFGRSASSVSSGFGDDSSKSFLQDTNRNLLLFSGSCSVESSAPDEGFICSNISSDETVVISDNEENLEIPSCTVPSPVLTARHLFSVVDRSAGNSPFCSESSDNGFVLRRRNSVPAMADLVRQNSMAAEMVNGFIKRRQQFGLPTCFDHGEEDCYVSSESSSPEARGQMRRPYLDDPLKEAPQQTTPKRRRPCYTTSGDTPVIPGGVLSSYNIDILSKETAFSPMQELFTARKHSAKKNSRRSGVPALARCLSASMALDENKVANSIFDRDHNKLSDDCENGTVLPLLESKTGCRSGEVHCISPETTSALIAGQYNNKISDFTFIDCRYPYEFDGGHIHGAVNLYTHEQLVNTFLYPMEKKSRNSPSVGCKKPSLLIFHCEFSSQRAPTLAKFLRNLDRSFNIHRYPFLFFPEIYVLQGGYSEYYKLYPDLCVPNDYIKMFDDRFKKDLIQSKRVTQVSKDACLREIKKRSSRLCKTSQTICKENAQGSS